MFLHGSIEKSLFPRARNPAMIWGQWWICKAGASRVSPDTLLTSFARCIETWRQDTCLILSIVTVLSVTVFSIQRLLEQCWCEKFESQSHTWLSILTRYCILVVFKSLEITHYMSITCFVLGGGGVCIQYAIDHGELKPPSFLIFLRHHTSLLAFLCSTDKFAFADIDFCNWHSNMPVLTERDGNQPVLLVWKISNGLDNLSPPPGNSIIFIYWPLLKRKAGDHGLDCIKQELKAKNANSTELQVYYETATFAFTRIAL